MKTLKVFCFIALAMILFAGPAPAADTATEIRLIVNHADCGDGSANFELIAGELSAGTYSPTVGCVCNSTPLDVTITDSSILSELDQAGCSNVSVAVNDSMKSLAIGFIRVEISRTESGKETICLVDYSGGSCGDRDLCDGYDYPGTATFGQSDIDGDGLIDNCDTDIDGDGVLNEADNCPSASNPDQEDNDTDSIGNACDACPNDSDNDVDGDGICGDADNCPAIANPLQDDADGDGTGNACDDDMDGDGIPNSSDNCPTAANPGQEDTDGDGTGDACELDAQIAASIESGLAWLVSQQSQDGSWAGMVAYTGFALVKLEDRAFELGYASPFDADYPYRQNVISGLNFLFGNAATYGDGTGICFSQGNHETYSTGIAMMAIAASRSPDMVVNAPGNITDTMTYKDVLQSAVDFFSWSQNPDGGWRYQATDRPSDNSNSGYAVLGLRYAEAPLYGFACTIPASVKDGLKDFIIGIQDPVDGDTNDGGSYYTTWGEWAWVNLLKTGNLLFEISFAGDNSTSQRAMDAVDYIERHWNDANNDPGWRPYNYQAMYCLMKGFESLDINNITVDGEEVDWFEEFAAVIIDTQTEDGSWPPDIWGDQLLTTVWALFVLEKVAPPPPIDVDVTVPDGCACEGSGYAVSIAYSAERFIVDGTLKVYKDGSLIDTLTLDDFTGLAYYTYNAGPESPGTYTWRAELDVAPSGGGTSAHREDTAGVTVCTAPKLKDIPDQTMPFSSFDLDDYLDNAGDITVTWSAFAPAGWEVAIDAENVATVTPPADATEPATITFTASASCCADIVCSASEQATFTSNQPPNQPPEGSNAYASPGCLWPPNNKYPMKEVGILGVTDPDGDPVTITITSITSDEKTATEPGAGGATFAPDASGVGKSSAKIRAERSGLKDGRVYVINFAAEDGKGGQYNGSVVVKVPRDQKSKSCVAVDSGQNYDATLIN
jgi:hypothetical protein